MNWVDVRGLSAAGAWGAIRDVSQWVTGALSPQNYGANNPITSDLIGTPVMENIRQQFKQSGCKSGVYCGDFQYSELSGTSTVAGQSVGSFCAQITNNGCCSDITVDVSNTWGLESGTRFPKLPWGGSNRGNQSVQQMIGGAFSGGGVKMQWPKSLLENRPTGAMKTVTMHYNWKEPNPCCK